MREDLDSESNRSIRDTADQQPTDGPDVAAALLSQARAELKAVLADAPPTTYVPWQGWALATDDFLVTRLMEMVVHADDLAASVDVPCPDFGPAVLDPVFRLLTALAVKRHGQDALVRTLTRPQRAPSWSRPSRRVGTKDTPGEKRAGYLLKPAVSPLRSWRRPIA